MTNVEIRMSKEARMTKLEGGFGTPNDVSSFGLRHSSFPRVSRKRLFAVKTGIPGRPLYPAP